jgi:hypothetical protein
LWRRKIFQFDGRWTEHLHDYSVRNLGFHAALNQFSRVGAVKGLKIFSDLAGVWIAGADRPSE